MILAHRAALELEGVIIKVGMIGIHKCREKLCVRVHPEHVVVGTPLENRRYGVVSGEFTKPLWWRGRRSNKYRRFSRGKS